MSSRTLAVKPLNPIRDISVCSRIAVCDHRVLAETYMLSLHKLLHPTFYNPKRSLTLHLVAFPHIHGSRFGPLG